MCSAASATLNTLTLPWSRASSHQVHACLMILYDGASR